jgi:hypothetical protein
MCAWQRHNTECASGLPIQRCDAIGGIFCCFAMGCFLHDSGGVAHISALGKQGSIAKVASCTLYPIACLSKSGETCQFPHRPHDMTARVWRLLEAIKSTLKQQQGAPHYSSCISPAFSCVFSMVISCCPRPCMRSKSVAGSGWAVRVESICVVCFCLAWPHLDKSLFTKLLVYGSSPEARCHVIRARIPNSLYVNFFFVAFLQKAQK